MRHARGTRETLVLDRVRKEDASGTATRSSPRAGEPASLSSLFPKGIQIGEVSSSSQTDTDLFQQVQIDPFVDFGALDAVLVLVPLERTG